MYHLMGAPKSTAIVARDATATANLKSLVRIGLPPLDRLPSDPAQRETLLLKSSIRQPAADVPAEMPKYLPSPPVVVHNDLPFGREVSDCRSS